MRILGLVLMAALLGCTCAAPSARFHRGKLLYSDDFNSPSGQWIPELENGGSVTEQKGKMEIDVPAGASVWFKPLLHGPLMIQYEVTVISGHGPNDRVSDLN